jgi:hypothetical protein
MCKAANSGEFPYTTKFKLKYNVEFAIQTYRSFAIQQDCRTLRDEMNDMEQLVALEFAPRVLTKAKVYNNIGIGNIVYVTLTLVFIQVHLNLANFNRIDILPITQDIMKVTQYLNRKLTEVIDEYKSGTIRQLAKQVLAAKVTVFNKKRGSEFVSITRKEAITCIARSKTPTHQIADLEKDMTEVEKMLQKSMTVLSDYQYSDDWDFYLLFV